MKYESQIALFLFSMKRFIEKHGYILVDREASNQFLASKNMTYAELEDVILSLTVSDCFDGPEPDRDPKYSEKWTVAEFSPLYRDEKLYLKMSIRMDAGRVKCLSVKLYVEKRVDE